MGCHTNSSTNTGAIIQNIPVLEPVVLPRNLTSVTAEASIVHLPLALEQVERTYRMGDDFVVVADDGSEMVFEKYFLGGELGEVLALLTRGNGDGEAVALEVSAEGEIVGTEVMALGRLDESLASSQPTSKAQRLWRLTSRC